MRRRLNEREIEILRLARADLCGIVWEPGHAGIAAQQWDDDVTHLRRLGYLKLYPRGGHIITPAGDQAFLDATVPVLEAAE